MIIRDGDIEGLIRSLGDMTILGYKASDLVRLAQALRNTGLEVEDLKDANKVFISGARYAIEKYIKDERELPEPLVTLVVKDETKSDDLPKFGDE